MPQNWNLGQIPDLRNQLVAASWDHKIDQVVIIKLAGKHV